MKEIDNQHSANWKWRMILGRSADPEGEIMLQNDWEQMDKVLEALYDADRRKGLGGSSPNVNRWLGDIRKYFQGPVVQILQRDALERLNLKQLLSEPELLDALEPDIHLAATLLSLKNAIPERTKNTARQVVQKVADKLIKRLHRPIQQAVRGSLNKAVRTNRPRLSEMDWHRTIMANLKHYQKDLKTIIPERFIGYGRKKHTLKRLVLLVDQSGSMATSLVYSGIVGSILGAIPSVKTHFIVFDTSTVDLTEHLSDPVELLFGVQLGGGTDIFQALQYAQSIIDHPKDTILVLISDLYDSKGDDTIKKVAQMQGSGIRFICLLALNDQGAPSYDPRLAAKMAALSVPVFACTPDKFPDLMGAALNEEDIEQWASKQGIVRKG